MSSSFSNLSTPHWSSSHILQQKRLKKMRQRRHVASTGNSAKRSRSYNEDSGIADGLQQNHNDETANSYQTTNANNNNSSRKSHPRNKNQYPSRHPLSGSLRFHRDSDVIAANEEKSDNYLNSRESMPILRKQQQQHLESRNSAAVTTTTTTTSTASLHHQQQQQHYNGSHNKRNHRPFTSQPQRTNYSSSSGVAGTSSRAHGSLTSRRRARQRRNVASPLLSAAAPATRNTFRVKPPKLLPEQSQLIAELEMLQQDEEMDQDSGGVRRVSNRNTNSRMDMDKKQKNTLHHASKKERSRLPEAETVSSQNDNNVLTGDEIKTAPATISSKPATHRHPNNRREKPQRSTTSSAATKKKNRINVHLDESYLSANSAVRYLDDDRMLFNDNHKRHSSSVVSLESISPSSNRERNSTNQGVTAMLAPTRKSTSSSIGSPSPSHRVSSPSATPVSPASQKSPTRKSLSVAEKFHQIMSQDIDTESRSNSHSSPIFSRGSYSPTNLKDTSSVFSRQSPKKSLHVFRVQTADGSISEFDNLRQFQMTSAHKSVMPSSGSSPTNQRTSLSPNKKRRTPTPQMRRSTKSRASSRQQVKRISKSRNSVAHVPLIRSSFNNNSTSIDHKIEAEAYVRERQLTQIIDELKWKIGTEDRIVETGTSKHHRKRTPQSPIQQQHRMQPPIVRPTEDIPRIEREMVSGASMEYFSQKKLGNEQVSPTKQSQEHESPQDALDQEELLSHEDLVKLGVAEIFVRRAVERYKLRRFEAAEKDVRRALSLEFDIQTKYCCFYLLGMSLHQREKYQEAVEVDLKAIKIYKQYGEQQRNDNETTSSSNINLHEKYDFFTAENIFNNCALSYFCLDKFEEALEMFHEALEYAESEPLDIQDNNQIRFYIYNKGCALYYMHQLDDAIDNFSMALSVPQNRPGLPQQEDPTVIADILYMRSLCYRFKQEHNLAEYDVDQIRRVLRGTGLHMNLLSLCHQKYLPRNVTLQIFSFLDTSSLAHVCCTNKYWYRLAWSKPIVSKLHLDLSGMQQRAQQWKSQHTFDLHISVEERQRRMQLNPFRLDFILKSKRMVFLHLTSLDLEGIVLHPSSKKNSGTFGSSSYPISLLSLVPSLRHLRVNRFAAASCNQSLRELGRVCPRVLSLDLSKMEAPFDGELRTRGRRKWTFQHFPELTHLNVSHCIFENSFDIFSDVGVCCEKLQLLVIRSCQMSSDEALFINQQNLLRLNKRVTVEL